MDRMDRACAQGLRGWLMVQPFQKKCPAAVAKMRRRKIRRLRLVVALIAKKVGTMAPPRAWW